MRRIGGTLMQQLRKTIVPAFAVLGVVALAQQLSGQGASPLMGAPPTHVGIIVRDVDQTAKQFEDVFGVKVPPAQTAGPISWPENPAGPNVQWRVKLTSFSLAGLTIELVEPLDGPGPHRAHLERYGQGMHHLAFAVPDRPAAFAFLRHQGGRQTSSTYVDLKELLGMTVEIAPTPRTAP